MNPKVPAVEDVMRPELEKVVSEIEKVIAGKREIIEKILLALLADGHVLLDDVPGVGKTTLAIALARSVGLAFERVQFTPDVLPSDLVGFSMYDQGSGTFAYHTGALNHANLLLGDEINRAFSKTQSALLEAMEERQVTVDGHTYPLPSPFLVIATQNSVGANGTQPLPFAQLDRFLVCLSLGYPDYEAQMTMLRDRQGTNPMDQVTCVLSKEELVHLQSLVRQVTAREPILDYITRLTMASHEHEDIEIGISPRGALFLDRLAKAKAFMDGRDYVTGADVKAVFKDACAHRVLLRKTAGKSAAAVLDDLLRMVKTPDRQFFPGLRK